MSKSLRETVNIPSQSIGLRVFDEASGMSWCYSVLHHIDSEIQALNRLVAGRLDPCWHASAVPQTWHLVSSSGEIVRTISKEIVLSTGRFKPLFFVGRFDTHIVGFLMARYSPSSCESKNCRCKLILGMYNEIYNRFANVMDVDNCIKQYIDQWNDTGTRAIRRHMFFGGRGNKTNISGWYFDRVKKRCRFLMSKKNRSIGFLFSVGYDEQTESVDYSTRTTLLHAIPKKIYGFSSRNMDFKGQCKSLDDVIDPLYHLKLFYNEQIYLQAQAWWNEYIQLCGSNIKYISAGMFKRGFDVVCAYNMYADSGVYWECNRVSNSNQDKNKHIPNLYTRAIWRVYHAVACVVREKREPHRYRSQLPSLHQYIRNDALFPLVTQVASSEDFYCTVGLEEETGVLSKDVARSHVERNVAKYTQKYRRGQKIGIVVSGYNGATFKVLSNNVELRCHYEILNWLARNKSAQKRGVCRKLRIAPRYVEIFKKHRLCNDDGEYKVDRARHKAIPGHYEALKRLGRNKSEAN
jgi:hypothetical protein